MSGVWDAGGCSGAGEDVVKRTLSAGVHVFAAVSTLLCLVIVASWIRSCTTVDAVYWLRPAQTSGGAGYDVWRVGSERGRLSLTFYRSTGMWQISSPTSWAQAGEWGMHWVHRVAGDESSDNPPPALWRRLGFDFSNRFSKDQFDAFWSVSAPHWAVLVPFGAAPLAFMAARVRRRHRRSRGLCPACGYDMRATPERCPECGAKSIRAPA